MLKLCLIQFFIKHLAWLYVLNNISLSFLGIYHKPKLGLGQICILPLLHPWNGLIFVCMNKNKHFFPSPPHIFMKSSNIEMSYGTPHHWMNNYSNTTHVIDIILDFYLHPFHTMKSVFKSFCQKCHVSYGL